MQIENYLDLDPSDTHVRNAANYWLCFIENMWCEYELKVAEEKYLHGESSGAALSKILNKTLKSEMKTIKYCDQIIDNMDKRIHDMFLQFDGGEHHEIEDEGDADSMRENLWRDQLRKGRLTNEEKKLMQYEPWDAIKTPPDYLTRLHSHLIQLIGWDKDERDFEIYRVMNF